jgi:predicted transcriptional regulator of viral defense system
MPGRHSQTVYVVAEAQHGYFTVAQAESEGVAPDRVRDMARRGVVERVSRGVYRMTQYPLSPRGSYLEAALWPAATRGGEPGVISHESALALYELSDVSPATLHVTVPSDRRITRRPPKVLRIHRAHLAPEEIIVHDGVPVTTVERAIRDVHASHLDPALVRQAIRDAHRSGYLTEQQATSLETELLDRQVPEAPPTTGGAPRRGRASRS